jgi:hypothetical protein
LLDQRTMSKRPKKKLSVKRRTLRRLGDEEARGVAGGAALRNDTVNDSVLSTINTVRTTSRTQFPTGA